MRRFLPLIAVLSLIIGGAAFLSAADQDQPQPGQQQQPQPGQQQPGQEQPGIVAERMVIYGVVIPQDAQEVPQGFQKTEVKDAPAIRKTIAELTQAVFQKGDHSKLLTCMTQKDQERLRESLEKADHKQLDDAVAQVQQTWKQKYNQEFDPSQQAIAFGRNFKICEGRITNPALLSNWPVKQPEREQPGRQPGEQPGAQPGQGGAVQPRAGQQPGAGMGQERGVGQGGMAPGLQGKQAAVVVFPASAGLPETYVSLIQEKDQWKIDLPDDLTAEQLQQNLVKHVTELSKDANQWPQDAKQAYGYAAHHILMAFYGGEGQPGAQPGKGAQPGQRQPGQGGQRGY